jgi:predicted DNA-binding transcriptional regulator AlpA
MKLAQRQVKTRAELGDIGKRRKELEELEAQLAKDTKTAIVHARRDKVPITEAADLVGLERTTIYQVYDKRPQTPRQPSPKSRRSARTAAPVAAAA